MTPEEKSMLERTLKLSEDNNSMLISMRRSARISTVLRIAYWVIIIGFSIGAYYFIEPYIGLLSKVYGGDISNVRGAASSLQDLLK